MVHGALKLMLIKTHATLNLVISPTSNQNRTTTELKMVPLALLGVKSDGEIPALAVNEVETLTPSDSSSDTGDSNEIV